MPFSQEEMNVMAAEALAVEWVAGASACARVKGTVIGLTDFPRRYVAVCMTLLIYDNIITFGQEVRDSHGSSCLKVS